MSLSHIKLYSQGVAYSMSIMRNLFDGLKGTIEVVHEAEKHPSMRVLLKEKMKFRIHSGP